jgi:hypothetical protein
MGGGDVIAGFIPVIRETQQGSVGEKNGGEYEGEDEDGGESCGQRIKWSFPVLADGRYKGRRQKAKGRIKESAVRLAPDSESLKRA